MAANKEPVEVIEAVTPAMIKAGLDTIDELALGNDRAYLVEAIYLSMEYQRLDALGQLRRVFCHGPQKSKS
jgi:hypothetical protein